MLSMRLRLVSPRAESEEVPELPEPRLEREARCGALQRPRGEAVTELERKNLIEEMLRSNCGWSRRFLEQQDNDFLYAFMDRRASEQFKRAVAGRIFWW